MGRIAVQEKRLTEQGQIPVRNEEDDDYCHFGKSFTVFKSVERNYVQVRPSESNCLNYFGL